MTSRPLQSLIAATRTTTATTSPTPFVLYRRIPIPDGSGRPTRPFPQRGTTPPPHEACQRLSFHHHHHYHQLPPSPARRCPFARNRRSFYSTTTTTPPHSMSSSVGARTGAGAGAAEAEAQQAVDAHVDAETDTEPALPPLSAHEFKQYNRLAEHMDYFVSRGRRYLCFLCLVSLSPWLLSLFFFSRRGFKIPSTAFLLIHRDHCDHNLLLLLSFYGVVIP